MITKEEKFVVNPLISWFKKQRASWKIYKPNFGTAATGWDIEAQRKNQDLLIEAKYIDGSFLASLNGLVTAPLASRRQHFLIKKYRSWSFGICWAIGTNYATRNLFQLLFDYFSRNPKFWEHYAQDLRLKYIYFVKDDRVAKVSFLKFLIISERYRLKAMGKPLAERRAICEFLLKKALTYT